MSATASSRAPARPKEFHFPLSVEWIGERRVAARVAGKSVIEIAPPPVFRGTDPSAWSPEDFLVTAAASCLASASLDLPVETRIEVTPPAGDQYKHPNNEQRENSRGPRPRHDGAALGP